MLKRIAAILLLGFYLITATEFNQLFKISFLIEHYYEHKQQKGDLSLFDFFSLHYANEEHSRSDDAHQHKLPFKSHEACVGNSLIAVLFPVSYGALLRPVSLKGPVFHVIQEDFISSSFLSSIWQPPKFC